MSSLWRQIRSNKAKQWKSELQKHVLRFSSCFFALGKFYIFGKTNTSESILFFNNFDSKYNKSLEITIDHMTDVSNDLINEVESRGGF